ncbi:hypothetical protein Dtox_2688 [Desulfofarcimen acetoxidans DSM 771]|uniref:Uncharacterized protein n=1 Tax=Desulfofarcimen acetoxidans (strain ATCC 49208 / DSM 771 / KCTC 5769 / VKM B-1644 / 5575) TaxID=485916 RepID=C8W172_DESAS|nr:hypothetical protein [Desulfofarcimen acetoxidans]ACV63468.1 hypothetical protein Dtox_2688 [Desulfofarcimen acetoxidans DSM 771]
MSKRFGKKKSELKVQGKMVASITGAKMFDDYKDACMRWANDLAERRGTNKFQICSVKPDEIKNFLERVAMTHRPDTVHHQYLGFRYPAAKKSVVY